MNKIGVFSVPRSGSTWLGQILNSSPEVVYRFQPNFAYSFKPTLSENSSPSDIEKFFSDLLETEDAFVSAKISISSKKNIIFEKKEPTTLVFKETHYINVIENVLSESDVKIVGLVRSPFSVINSWRKIPKEFSADWDLREEWRSAPSKNEGESFNYFGYEKWKEATILFEKLAEKYFQRFYLINYDDLLEDTKRIVKELFGFCGLEMNKQTEDFITNSKVKNDTDAYSVFRQKSDDNQWVKELPSYIVEEIKNDEDFVRLNKKFSWI